MIVCRSCNSIRRRKWRPKLPPRPPKTPFQICRTCQIEKPIQAFVKYRHTYRKMCLVCKQQFERIRKSGLKWCFTCKTSKSLSSFYFMGITNKLRRSKCIECYTAYERSPAVKHREKERGRFYRTGFTPALWETVLSIQKGVCGICDVPLTSACTPHADHDHRTQQPRGILCRKCNTAIGLLKDNPNILRRAADYLDAPPLHARTEWEDLV